MRLLGAIAADAVCPAAGFDTRWGHLFTDNAFGNAPFRWDQESFLDASGGFLGSCTSINGPSGFDDSSQFVFFEDPPTHSPSGFFPERTRADGGPRVASRR